MNVQSKGGIASASLERELHVGTCVHVAATIWYLGFARYHSLKFDSRYDWSVHLKDASETEPHLIDNEVDDIEE